MGTFHRAGLRRPQDGDGAYCSPDSIARRMAAGEAVSVRELPAPRFPALSTLGFAPASYPSRLRDAPVRPGACCSRGLCLLGRPARARPCRSENA